MSHEIHMTEGEGDEQKLLEYLRSKGGNTRACSIEIKLNGEPCMPDSLQKAINAFNFHDAGNLLAGECDTDDPEAVRRTSEIIKAAVQLLGDIIFASIRVSRDPDGVEVQLKKMRVEKMTPQERIFSGGN